MLWSTIFGGKFRAKNAPRKRKVLAEHLLFLLWPAIINALEKLINGGGWVLLSSGRWENIENLISKGGGTLIWHLRVETCSSGRDFFGL